MTTPDNNQPKNPAHHLRKSWILKILDLENRPLASTTLKKEAGRHLAAKDRARLSQDGKNRATRCVKIGI